MTIAESQAVFQSVCRGLDLSLVRSVTAETGVAWVTLVEAQTSTTVMYTTAALAIPNGTASLTVADTAVV